MAKREFNTKYIKILSDIFQHLPTNKYIVLGSAATLSFTSKIGYKRKMNDLDVIVDISLVKKIKENLIKKGFKRSTFINKRMPFYSKLIKYGKSTYLRFTNDGINVEILVTKFDRYNSDLKFELYPNIWVKIPIKSLVKTSLGKSQFTTLELELLWAIKKLLNDTLGKLILYKKNQRDMDLKVLRKNVNLVTAKKLLSTCRFGYKQFSFKVPITLIK